MRNHGPRASDAFDPISYKRLEALPSPAAATEQMVRMRDGIRLATDVYLPEDGGTGPTILTRLPYDKAGEYTFIPEIAGYFVEHGYRFVAQDVRGKFRSEGESLIWVNEANDGFDTIEWIANQPWSDGTVGMWGDSYFGYTQLAAVSTAHPALRAIVPRVTGTRLGDLPAREPGSRTADPEMSVIRLYLLSHFQSNDTFEWEMEWRRPFADQAERWFQTVGERSPSYDLWMPHPVRLRRFPSGHPFDAPPVPILQTIGWWDNCAPWQWEDHELIAERPAWAANEYLLLEPIDHESYEFLGAPYTEENDHAVNPAARKRLLPQALDPAIEFFDVFLRGQGSPRDIPRVRWRVAGESEVRTAPSWPPPGATTVEFYPEGESLRESKSADVGEAVWTHDPSDPVQSPVANPFAFLQEFPDEASLAERSDVVGFVSAPVTEELLLAGPLELGVTFSSSGPEADLFARLTDLAPDGSAHLIARGQVTLFDAERDAALEIPMGHVGHTLKEGHRLRLTVAGSDAPEFVPAPGTGEHRWLAVETRTTEQRLRLGGEAGAVLRLTVLVPER